MKHIKQQNKRVSPSPEKGAITERGLFRLMLPSLLGILLCSTCLAGLTWAYFSDSVTSSANNITAATFTVDVTITEITETGGDPLTTAEAGSAGTAATDTTTVSSPADVSAEQEENTSSDTPSATTSNTAANAEGNTLMANVLSVGTTTSPADSQGDEGSSSDTGSDNSTGSETGTGEGSTPAEGTPEVGSDPENEAAGEGSPAAASSPNTESVTDTPNTTTAVERNADGSYTLQAGKKYTVTLKASGTATGYCNISFGDVEYHTVALVPNSENNTISFTVYASEDYTFLTITPQWGTCNEIEDDEASILIDNDGRIGTPTTDANATEQADSPAVTEPSADTDETLSGETGQSNEQTTNGETAGGTIDEQTGSSTGEAAGTAPGESGETTGGSTDGDEQPAGEGTDTEKANSEPPADEPTDTPSEGQSE